MRKIRRAAYILLAVSALLFFASFYFSVFADKFPLPAKTAAPPQAVPTAAAENALPDPQWVDLDVPNLSSTYFIQRLSDEQRQICAGIYKSIAAFETEIALPEPIDEKTLSEMMWLISYDCPELFQISGDYTYYVRPSDPNRVLSIKPSYVMTPESYGDALQKITDILNGWLEDAHGMNDYQTEKLLYERLMQTCVYQEEGPHTGTVYGALVNGRARCEGYAKVMCMALRMADIECLILTGEATTTASNEEPRVEKHAWNMANIDGSFCQIDATWDDMDDAFAHTTCYAYFNLTDEEMYKSRTLDEVYLRWDLPACTNDAYSYHAQADTRIRAREDIKTRFTDMLEASYNDEQNFVMGQFETEEQLATFTESMEDWISAWYRKKHFSSGSYHWVTYADSKVFLVFNLSYD